MSNLITLEDDLFDLYEKVINDEDIPLIYADDEEGVEEATRSGNTYVALEVEDLDQVGTVFRYPPFTVEGETFQKSKTEWIFPLTFVAYGNKARETLFKIARSHNSWGGISSLYKSGIALRTSGPVRSMPRISGASKERGFSLTLNMGLTDLVTDQIQVIESSTVTGTIRNGDSDFEVVTTVELETYLEVHGYGIETIIKDYSDFDERWDHIIDLGLLGTPLKSHNDAGYYPGTPEDYFIQFGESQALVIKDYLKEDSIYNSLIDLGKLSESIIKDNDAGNLQG